MASKRGNPKISCQDLISSGGSFYGWLKKQSDGWITKYNKHYCVLHNGYLFSYDDPNAAAANGCISLSGYKATENADVKKKFAFQIEHVGFLPQKDIFLACSTAEMNEWISHITHEVAKSYPGSLKREERGNADGSDTSDDDDDFQYDYTQEKPTDISFTNPEACDRLKAPSPSCEPSPTFQGPRIVETVNNSIKSKCYIEKQPKPPPRPALHGSDNQKIRHKLQAYEVSPINFPKANVKYGEKYTDLEKNIQNTSLSPPLPERMNPIGKATSPKQLRENSRFGHGDGAISDENILPPSVYQWSVKREKAEDILKATITPGTYLIRKGAEERHVLSVYTSERSCKARHYIIFQKNGEQFLAQPPAPRFLKIGDLVRHYMKNPLPTCAIKLSKPYSESS